MSSSSHAIHANAQESTPLLAHNDAEMGNATPAFRSSSSSTSAIIGRAFRDPGATLAQVGLVVNTGVLWRVLWTHPAGLFTYHPSFQSLAILLFFEGVLLLQPPPVNAAAKKKGLQLHQIVQLTSLVLIVTGAAFIWYNKAVHNAKHIQTWHARFGVATLSLIFLQIIFGAFVVWSPLQRVFGSETRAKSLWKYHRMSGYLTLTLLLVTPALALASDWVRLNSHAGERWAIGLGLALVAVGTVSRIQTGKLGLKRN
ncbi:hypothetical protein JCM8547_008754 [Rhodosporidiobolus lusitaniae]